MIVMKVSALESPDQGTLPRGRRQFFVIIICIYIYIIPPIMLKAVFFFFFFFLLIPISSFDIMFQTNSFWTDKQPEKQTEVTGTNLTALGQRPGEDRKCGPIHFHPT